MKGEGQEGGGESREGEERGGRVEAEMEGGGTLKAGEGSGGGRNQDGQSLGTAAGSPHFQSEPIGTLGKNLLRF